MVVVAPATFNTVAKLATGIADTYAHSRLCEALGQRLPVVLVPMINNKLWGHPALEGHLRTLAEARVAFVNCLSVAMRKSPQVAIRRSPLVAK